MNRWLQYVTAPSTDGSYHVHALQVMSGSHVDLIPEFISQLADLVVGYATSSNPDIHAVFNGKYRVDVAAAELARNGVKRLLQRSKKGLYTTLMGFVGECLAHWALCTFVAPLACTEPEFGSTSPAFDLVGLIDQDGTVRTNCIQAKVSHGYALLQCYRAIAKFRRLDNGEYDLELANRLSLLLRRNAALRISLGTNDWRRVLLDRARRNYTIFVAFSGVSPSGHLTIWQQRSAGPPSSRMLLVLPVSDVNRFMTQLAKEIHARIP